jgi:LysR family transcriptional regulator, transcriptional activator of nhaA
MKDAFAAVEWLNYHHLRHFWVIARLGHMTRAAQLLKVSQSTLSEQVRELEEWLGEPLFERRGRSLHLTEAGQVALEHAETIFETGRDLLDCFRQRDPGRRRLLRVGAVGPLSKNLQYDFIQPLLEQAHTRVEVAAGSLDELLRRLHQHDLDIVLSNIAMRPDHEPNVFSHLLGEMPVYLVGSAPLKPLRGKFPECLQSVPLFLPSRESHVRGDFDLSLAAAGMQPDIRAEVDDMALLRLLALSGRGLALVPAIVVERELRAGRLRHFYRVPKLLERFYAITLRRRFGQPWLEEVVADFRARLKALAALSKNRKRG